MAWLVPREVNNLAWFLFEAILAIKWSFTSQTILSRLALVTAPTSNKESLLVISVINPLAICNVAFKSNMSIFGVALNCAATSPDNPVTNATFTISSVFSLPMLAKLASHLIMLFGQLSLRFFISCSEARRKLKTCW